MIGLRGQIHIDKGLAKLIMSNSLGKIDIISFRILQLSLRVYQNLKLLRHSININEINTQLMQVVKCIQSHDRDVIDEAYAYCYRCNGSILPIERRVYYCCIKTINNQSLLLLHTSCYTQLISSLLEMREVEEQQLDNNCCYLLKSQKLQNIYLKAASHSVIFVSDNSSAIMPLKFAFVPLFDSSFVINDISIYTQHIITISQLYFKNSLHAVRTPLGTAAAAPCFTSFPSLIKINLDIPLCLLSSFYLSVSGTNMGQYLRYLFYYLQFQRSQSLQSMDGRCPLEHHRLI